MSDSKSLALVPEEGSGILSLAGSLLDVIHKANRAARQEVLRDRAERGLKGGMETDDSRWPEAVFSDHSKNSCTIYFCTASGPGSMLIIFGYKDSIEVSGHPVGGEDNIVFIMGCNERASRILSELAPTIAQYGSIYYKDDLQGGGYTVINSQANGEDCRVGL